MSLRDLLVTGALLFPLMVPPSVGSGMDLCYITFLLRYLMAPGQETCQALQVRIVSWIAFFMRLVYMYRLASIT